MKEDAVLRAQLGRIGYHSLGGTHRAVYRHQSREEVLKLAVTRDLAEIHDALTSFRQALEISGDYAPRGLMPEVLDMGEDFLGTGYPWLRERYVSGNDARPFGHESRQQMIATLEAAAATLAEYRVLLDLEG